MAQKLTAIVVGGGIGGLAASIALSRAGFRVTVLERQPAVRVSGSGIYIWENGLRTLAELGAAQVYENGFRGRFFEQRNARNEVIDAGPLSDDLRLITIPRGQLVEGLRQAAVAAGVDVVTMTEVARIEAQGHVFCLGGTTMVADLVIGADGAWSIARRSLGLERVHELTEEGGIRAIIPGTQADLGENGQDRYIEVWSGLRRFLITPISQSEIYLALTSMDGDVEAKKTPIAKDLWKASFPNWQHLIDRVSDAIAWSPYSIVKVSRWSAGNAAILGDAAHAQPPNLGQGAGMAMQSAVALGAAMTGISDRREIPAALETWERGMRPLVDHCQKWSCLYNETAFLPDEVRDRVTRAIVAEPWIREQLQRAARSKTLPA